MISVESDEEVKDNKRKLHRSPPNHIRIAEILQAQKLWKMGHRGISNFDKIGSKVSIVMNHLILIQVLEFMWLCSILVFKMAILIFLILLK